MIDQEVAKILSRLKEAFEESIGYINSIENNNDVEGNLGYLIRDWNTNPSLRNSLISKDIDILKEHLEYLENSKQ